MFNLDPAKLLIIGVVAMLLLGPDKLPQVARQVGGAWRSFNEFRHRMETEVRGSIPDLPSTNDIAKLARSPSALLNHLSNMDSNGDTAHVADTNGSAANGATTNGSIHPLGPTAPNPPRQIRPKRPTRPCPEPLEHPSPTPWPRAIPA